MNVPQHIELDADSLTLHWPNGVTQRVTHHVLRHACPCAECRRIRMNGADPVVPTGIAVLDLCPAGYGVQLRFSDNHERGIFPWAYLEQLRSPEVPRQPAQGF